MQKVKNGSFLALPKKESQHVRNRSKQIAFVICITGYAQLNTPLRSIADLYRLHHGGGHLKFGLVVYLQHQPMLQFERDLVLFH